MSSENEEPNNPNQDAAVSGLEAELAEFEDYPSEVSVHDTKALVESNSDVTLVDCREPREYAIARIEGSILIPIDELADRVSELQEYREKRIIVHCHHGGRSLSVVNWLRNHGFEKAQNMTGGIDVWSQEIDSDVPRY